MNRWFEVDDDDMVSRDAFHQFDGAANPQDYGDYFAWSMSFNSGP